MVNDSTLDNDNTITYNERSPLLLSEKKSDELNEVNIEEGFKLSGSCGTYQIILQLIFTYFVICIGSTSLVPYFILDAPSWKCNDNITSTFCRENFGKRISPENEYFNERCKLERFEWSYTTRRDYSAVTEYDLICEHATYAAVPTSMHFLGGVIGSIVCGKAAATYGRRIVMMICIVVTIVSSLGCVYVTHIWHLICLRGIIGASTSPSYSIAAIYLMEFVPPKHRALSGLLYQGTYCLSVLILDGIGWAERRWRRLLIYVTLPSLLAFISFLFLPASPRWLLSTGKVKQAEVVLSKIATRNGTSFVGTLQAPRGLNDEHSYSYLDLFRHKKVALLTVAQGCLWMTSAMLYFAIGLESSKLGGDMYQVFALSVLVEIPGTFVSLYLCNRWGRKKSIVGSLITCAVFTGSIAAIPRSYAIRHTSLNIIFALSAKFCIHLTYSSLYIWSFEIYPTVIRSQGLSFCATLENIGGMTSPFLVGTLQNVSYILPFITMALVAMFTAILGLTLPETNGMPTREVYDDFFVKVNEPETVTRDEEVANQSV